MFSNWNSYRQNWLNAYDLIRAIFGVLVMTRTRSLALALTLSLTLTPAFAIVMRSTPNSPLTPPTRSY